MDGTVTLVKVLSPAPVVSGSLAPNFTHKLVAVVLTVHAPSTAANFAAIYTTSKLIDSKKLVHIGKSTARYRVASCVQYQPFSIVASGKSQTGCVVFLVPVAAIPVELKISGKAEGDWTIASTDVQPGLAPPAAAPAPVGLGTTPGAQALGATTTTIAGSTTTVAPGTSSGSGPTATTAPVGGGGASPATTAKPSPAVAARHPHHHGVAAAPRIIRFAPLAGLAGSHVQIWGRKLSGTTEVTFGGVPAAIQSTSPGKILAVVPAGAQSGPVVVTTSSGTATSPKTFVVF